MKKSKAGNKVAQGQAVQVQAVAQAQGKAVIPALLKAFEGREGGHTIRRHYISKFPICEGALKALEVAGVAVPYNVADKGRKVACPRSKVGAVIDVNQLSFVNAVQKAGFFTTPKLLSPRYVADVFRCYFLECNKEAFASALSADTQGQKVLHSSFSVNTFKASLKKEAGAGVQG